MGSINDVIDAFRRAPTNVDRGTLFEQLMVRFFELDPALNQQYESVWRWIDWPDRQGKPDTGIDLVARERDTGNYTAIQCKFYEPTHTLAKADIDSFFTASGKKPFTNRVIISTTDKWGKNAEDALDDQAIPVQRINLADIAESPIDWDIAWPQDSLTIELSPAERKQPRPHQVEAIGAVLAGYAVGNDRGKLIMACGTGKTFTALKLAERVASENGGTARILFLVPSISLLSQSLREWTAQTALDIRAFAVCSDTKVGRLRNAEDFNVHDVPIPVTTSPANLVDAMAHRKRAKGLTVVFSTYQSLPTVADAQTLGLDDFDLAICDEAHRTTGVTLAGEDDSNFVRIHDNGYLHANLRLYMTATPRIFSDAVKDKADQHSAELVSMDDELRYGPEFHHLSFGDAVEHGLLTDYKVLVLTVDESVMAAPLQQQQAIFGEIPNLDDASKIIGCWNGLAKRAGATADGTPSFTLGEPPMQRAVAFAKDIATSKHIADLFPRVVTAYQESLNKQENEGHPVEGTNRDLACEVHHVDGTFNALERNAELAWLKSPVAEGECRILTNARCLSEGVDVPALDAVLFLHPRNSIVDVVQSVGRVMRLSPGKDYGYVILPVAVPAGVDPATALADNVRFKVVWQVLNALRSHDERFDAMINSIALNQTDKKTGQGNNRLLGGHIGPTANGTDGDTEVPTKAVPAQMALFSLSEWQEAIYTRIVDKVGTRVYWDQWATDVADIAQAQITRINAILDDPSADKAVIEQFDWFLKGLRDNLNDSVTRSDAISMLSQHLITKPVFDALFAGHDFAIHNPVSKVMQAMVDALDGTGLESETARLDKFYDSVRLRAEQVVSADGKQHLIADLYEKFFRTAFKKQSDALGIVYTPVEVVDFILRAADHASRAHLGKGLTDEGVHILDGFTGTGTFLTRLLQSGLITPGDLKRKYSEELHANEIMLLAYYIAAVNIETTYHALTGKTTGADDYEPFPGIVLADTFQIHEADDTLDAEVFAANNERIAAEIATPIGVIIGNPPYSVGQTSANDLNANNRYPTLDRRIEATYARRSTARSQRTLYDSYIRALRWATDRIGDIGVVAFVSNGGWIDGNTADGIRLTLAEDYSHIYVYNLRGNQRTAGELSRREGGKVFGGGSRNTVAILIGVKAPAHAGSCQIHYRDVGEYLSREQKLRIVSDSTLDSPEWRDIVPSEEGDWINQRNSAFGSWPALGRKKGDDSSLPSVFATYSLGLATGRDAWCYNFSKSKLETQVKTMIGTYEDARTDFATLAADSTKRIEDAVNIFLDTHPQHMRLDRISWNRNAKQDLVKNREYRYVDSAVTPAMYRPFTKQYCYFHRDMNAMLYQLPALFPTPRHKNVGIVLTGPASHFEFTPFITSELPNLHLLDTAQFFTRWRYQKADEGTLDLSENGDVDEHGYRRLDNITDQILVWYRDAIRAPVEKDDIFYYVYGILHDPAYRSRYAADLKKMLPHVPTPNGAERFKFVADIGRKLAQLHLNYEQSEPYPLEVNLKSGTDPKDRETWRVAKMRWRSKTDKSAILYNGRITIAGIPDTAHEYILGSRTALEWLIDRYQVKTDKASGIVNDPNDWCDEHNDPTYIVNLIKRVTTVSVETAKLVTLLAEAPDE
ncbi:helicase [Mycobacterium sp. 852013-51886_SCH5428379]|uniref:DEAD/DEAH box helicase n=1 Tax=Mycobacterium sp. 852013-51886_SCH5428379 TaxID=1834111 RepID=UPI0007FDE728|nr:DEAD/DEAH box helicase [Mycobacterium sp. 852013-51886_SCH5428379]OBB57816.1 helicase [Mycobacterium sp. 852013-51886_SCH5428379]